MSLSNGEGLTLPGVKTDFSDLDDTPSSFTGEAFKVPAVNAGETALEFVTALSTDNYAHFRDEKPNATQGGSSISGTQTRTLNTTKVNNIPGCSLSSDQVTLAAGDYYIVARAGALFAQNHKIQLYNVSTSTYDLIGSNAYTGASSVQTDSWIKATLTVTASHTFELRHRIVVATATNGLGVASFSGEVEVYAEMWIWRVC
jgi:hypothetical protein